MLALSSGEVNSLPQTVRSEKKIFSFKAAAFDANLYAGDKNVPRKRRSDR
jgi:hypothetical protein